MIMKFVKNTMIIAAFLVALMLISSSSLSVKLSDKSEINNSNFEDDEKEITQQRGTLTGLDPNRHSKKPNSLTTVRNNNKIRDGKINQALSLESKLMYGYIGYDSCEEEGPCYFPLDDPGNITGDQGTGSGYILAGGTWTCDEEWYGCEYNSGGLWKIDPYTFDMEQIGGGGTACNGLAWDPVYNRLYGASGTHLIEYDPETGEQDLIGSFGLSGKTIIAIAINMQGICYAWDVLFSGSSTLYTVDLETGEAIEVGSMNQNLIYAQDGAFDWDTDILYLTAYSQSGFLATCDTETGELTHLGDFECGAEITASMIMACCCPAEHDVGVKAIVKPSKSSHAIPEMEMELLVKNYGLNYETFYAQMEINNQTNPSSSTLMWEDFSGSFPPEGWETDSFTQCNDSCSPDPPCACLFKYNQVQNYSAYITSKPVDASEYKKLSLTFYFAGNLNYPQYCNFFVKVRKNESSPWKDVSPWDNPLGHEFEGNLFEIDFYGFGENMGEDFQIKWELIGYYYYYNWFVLDSILLEGTNDSIEYAELVEDITIGPGEETTIEFPTWTPSLWQDPEYENKWVNYTVHAFTILEGDQNPMNDNKYKLIELHFGFFHDLELTSIGSPYQNGPGKTYPVEATIKNVGQYADCCIPIDIEIGEPILLDTLLAEDSWDTVPPEGWYDEHKDSDPGYGWIKSFSSSSGGSSPEARLHYSKAKSNHVLYSYAINATNYSSCLFEFKSYIHHNYGQRHYSLEAGYSTDGETWYTAWHEEPRKSGNYEVECSIVGGHETLYIGFWFKGDPYYFNNWYIDDISLKAFDLVPEYSDSACQGDNLEPGESRTFEFDDWTPDFLQYETTGKKNYMVHAEINMEGDSNPGNDFKSEFFSLDYWHDVGIGSILSPNYGTRKNALCWDNGGPDGRNGLAGSKYQGYSNIIIDDFQNDEDWYVSGGHFSFIWDSGYSEGNLESVKVYFYEETGNCEPSEDEYAEPEITEILEYATGAYYFGRPEIAVDIEFDHGVALSTGQWWVGFQPEGINDDIAYLLTSRTKGCEVMADLPYWGIPRWTSSQDIWGEDYDLAWYLTCHGCPCPRIYIPLGIQDIDIVVKNFGTFPKRDLTCNAKIYEYITDPPFGTLVYEDNVTDIDLEEPLGGEELLEFKDYNFSMEGKYDIYLNMPAPYDDYPWNNKISQGLFVDNTAPISSYELDPPEPDGENGWYVSYIEVTLEATDSSSNGSSSGVAEIKYNINGGVTYSIPGSSGTFMLTPGDEGGEFLVEYWAVDRVGNVETPKNSFTVKMDLTNPVVDLIYEVIGGNPLTGWELLFTATATDAASGMERVEFYLNDVWQKTIEGSGPIFEWSFIYHGGLNLLVTSFGYDNAGNMASDVVVNPVSYPTNQNMQQQTQNSKSSFFINFLRLDQILGFKSEIFLYQ